jgi:hypothetical protein
MHSIDDFVPLESAIGSLRQTAPAFLKAIASAVRTYRQSDVVSSELVSSRAYGKPIPGFTLTYSHLGDYLDLAVTKHAGVFIETEAGVFRAENVFINRRWLMALNELAILQPGVAQPIALRSFGTQKASVTPLFPQLEDQTPDSVRAELKRLKIQIERSLVLPGEDARDREIESLRAQLTSLEEAKSQSDELCTAQAMTLKMLTLENDQLRKTREEAVSSRVVPAFVEAVRPAERPISNVEMRNLAIREARCEAAKLAMALWASPDLAACRTGKMAQLVRDHIDAKYAELLPATNISLAKWLSSDVAPPSARRRGRPSKSDPNK